MRQRERGGQGAACRSARGALPRGPPSRGGEQDPYWTKPLDTPDIAAARAGRGLEFQEGHQRTARARGARRRRLPRRSRARSRAASPASTCSSSYRVFSFRASFSSECAVGRFSLPMFYAKRARRILPALLVVVSCVWIVGWFRAAPIQFRDIGGGLLGNSYFTVNFWLLRLAGVGGYFGADSSDKASAAPLVAQHRGAVLSRLVGPLVGGLRAETDRLLPAVILGHLSCFLRLLRRPDADRSDRRILSALDAGMGARARRAPRLSRGLSPATRCPIPPASVANIGAATWRRPDRSARIFLMSEVEPFPGWRAAIPTRAARSSSPIPVRLIGDVALGNRIAGFFGVISYPLYLWHWPLFAFAHIWPGVIPTPAVMFALGRESRSARDAHLCSWSRRRSRRRFATRALRESRWRSSAALAATGIVGRITYDAKGLSRPLSAAGRAHLRLRRQRRAGQTSDAMLLSARRPRLSARRGARAGGPLLRGRSLRRAGRSQRSRRSLSSAIRMPRIFSPASRRRSAARRTS